MVVKCQARGAARRGRAAGVRRRARGGARATHQQSSESSAPERRSYDSASAGFAMDHAARFVTAVLRGARGAESQGVAALVTLGQRGARRARRRGGGHAAPLRAARHLAPQATDAHTPAAGDVEQVRQRRIVGAVARQRRHRADDARQRHLCRRAARATETERGFAQRVRHTAPGPLPARRKTASTARGGGALEQRRQAQSRALQRELVRVHRLRDAREQFERRAARPQRRPAGCGAQAAHRVRTRQRQSHTLPGIVVSWILVVRSYVGVALALNLIVCVGRAVAGHSGEAAAAAGLGVSASGALRA